MGIENILIATEPQFMDLYKEKTVTDPSADEYIQEQQEFVLKYLEIQKVALQDNEELQKIDVTAYQIFDAFRKIIKKSKSIPPMLYDSQLIDGKYKLTGDKVKRADLCNLCHHEEPSYHEYTLLNVKNQMSIDFRELNLHSWEKHRNFSSPSKWGGHSIDPILACKVLGLTH